MSEDVASEVAEMNKAFDAPVLEPEKESDKSEAETPDDKGEEPESEKEPGSGKEPESDEGDGKDEGEGPEEEPEPKPESEPEPDEKGEKAEPEPGPEGDKDKGKEPIPDPVVVELRNTLATVQTELAEDKAEKQAPEKKEEEPEAKPEEKIEDQDFVGEVDLDEVARDPKELNKIFNNIYRKARSDSEAAIIKRIPGMVNEQAGLRASLQVAAEDFYKANEDLRGFPKVVTVVFDELVDKDSNRTYEEVMKETAIEARKRLGLSEPEPGKEGKDKDKSEKASSSSPKLPKKGSRSGKVQDKSEPSVLQSQLDDMSKAVKG